jgi:hypothetical protein
MNFNEWLKFAEEVERKAVGDECYEEGLRMRAKRLEREAKRLERERS